MNATKFLASGISVILPTKSSPKVCLAIDNPSVAIQSYKLYNPFSLKARLLKSITKFVCVYLNPLAKTFLPTIKNEGSNFIQELETRFSQKIQSSVYFSTANDKVVLQLQNNGKVMGYLKYAISPIGEKRILNEKKAMDHLSSLNLAPKLLHTDFYEQRPYIVIENIEGSIGWVDDYQYLSVLDSLYKEKRHKLKDHPRIHNLIASLEEYQLNDLRQTLLDAIEPSNEIYNEVFEHGDFAPWNLIKIKNKIVAFDFEYFEEIGLQYLDEVKYHFQLNYLMNKKVGEELIESISNKIRIPEFNIIFFVFVIKEIIQKFEANEPYILESSLLDLLLSKAR